MLAIDLVDTYSNGFQLKGASGMAPVSESHGAIGNSVALAPAIEYNWSADAGVIFGVEFSAAGRNTPSYIAPQVAVAWSF